MSFVGNVDVFDVDAVSGCHSPAESREPYIRRELALTLFDRFKITGPFRQDLPVELLGRRLIVAFFLNVNLLYIMNVLHECRGLRQGRT